MRHLFKAAAVAVLGMSSAASAATLSGTFWDAPADSLATINDAIGYATGNAADATFTSTGVNYGDVGTGWDIGSLADFLNADAGSIDPAAAGALYFQESVIKLTGSVALNDGDTINVTSDDGFRLIIGGSTFSEFLGLRGPGGTTSATWSGGSGIFDVTLWYFEGNETQAQLISNLGDYATGVVPLPAGGVLILTALGGLGILRARRKA